MIIQMAQLIMERHKNQLRKWTSRPYYEHCQRVGMFVAGMPFATEELVCIALGHDLIEDTETLYSEILAKFNKEVADGIKLLTNPSKQHTHLNRKARKEMDWEHLKVVPDKIKFIKLVDRIDNLEEMQGCKDDFRKLYKEESQELRKRLVLHSKYSDNDPFCAWHGVLMGKLWMLIG